MVENTESIEITESNTSRSHKNSFHSTEMCKSAAKMRLSQEEKAIKMTRDRQVTGNPLKHLSTI